MNDKTTEHAPAWACYAGAAVAGWIVLVFAAIFALIGMSAIAASLDRVVVVGSGAFFVEVVVAVLVAGTASYFSGRSAYRWFVHRAPMTVYVLVAVLLLLAVISLPVPFTFVLRG